MWSSTVHCCRLFLGLVVKQIDKQGLLLARAQHRMGADSRPRGDGWHCARGAHGQPLRRRVASRDAEAVEYPVGGVALVQQAIDAVVDEALEAGRVVGAVVLARDHGESVYARAAGYADREAGIPMALDTVFRWSSLTKPVVAATALALMEHGRLDLDDPVTRFLPDFQPRLPDGSAPTINVWHLLTHTAGLAYPSLAPDDPYVAAGVSSGLDQPGMSMQENLRRIASAPLSFRPGTAWRYSVATDVLGAIIAVVHGMTLADAVATHITGPLGMRDSAFVVREPARLAVPYADGNPRAVRMGELHRVEEWVFSPARAFDQRSFQSGGCGMVGTAGDFVTFLETLRTGGAPILTRETVQLASRNQVGSLREQEEPGWGFGFLSAVLTDAERAGSPAHRECCRGRGLRAFVVPRSGGRAQRRRPDQHSPRRLHGLIPCRCPGLHLRLAGRGSKVVHRCA
jgi:CubicO group peptidase (beta-lactamase class C family)